MIFEKRWYLKAYQWVIKRCTREGVFHSVAAELERPLSTFLLSISNPFPPPASLLLLGAVLKFKDFPVQMNWVVSSGLLWNRRCTLFAGVPGSQPVYVISFGQKIIWICIMMVYFSLEVTVRRLQLCAYLSMEFKLWKKSQLLGKRVKGVKTRRAVGRLV